MIKLDLYKYKVAGKDNTGKIYARANNDDPIGIEGLAEHIQSHGSPYTYDVILGVLAKVASCVRELVLGGTPVKIDNLCIFTPAVTTLPANDVERFSLGKATRADDGTYDSSNGNVKSVRMHCRLTGKAAQASMTKDAVLGFTSLAQRIKNGEAILSNRKGEYLASSGSSGGNSGGSGGGEPVVNP